MTKMKLLTKISKRKKEAWTHGKNFGGTNKICWTLLIWFNNSVVTLQAAVMENRTTVRGWEVNWKQNNMLPWNAEEVRVTCLWCIKMHHSLVEIKILLKSFQSLFSYVYNVLAKVLDSTKYFKIFSEERTTVPLCPIIFRFAESEQQFISGKYLCQVQK